MTLGRAMPIEGAPLAANAEGPSLRAWYALGVLIVAGLFGAVDRQILVLVTEPLKHEMHLADIEIGLLQGLGPGLFAAAGAVALGWLADRTARQLVLAICVLAWSAATAACGLAHTFGQLFAATIAIALGETALAPVMFSMVPDLFPGKSRITANFILFGAITIGAGFGIALGGGAIAWIEAHHMALPVALRHFSAWRLSFLALAVPGVPIALAVLAIGSVSRQSIHTVVRGTSESTMTRYFQQHWPALAALYIAASFYGIAQYAAYAWTPVYIVRVLGASAAGVGAGVGTAVTFGSVAGVCLATASAKLLSRRFGVMTAVRLYQGTMALYLIPVLLQLPVQHPWQAYILVGIQTTTGVAGAAVMPTLLQDLSPASIRARLIALGTAFFSFAIAAAPILVGGVSDTLSRYPRGLLWALVLVSAPSIAAAVVLLGLCGGTIQRTIQALTPGGNATLPDPAPVA
jgi:MFS family permease